MKTTLALALIFTLGCNSTPAAPTPAARADAGLSRPTEVVPTPVTAIPGHEVLAQDHAPKEPPRLMPAETLIRSYLALFGGLSPQALQVRLRGTTGDNLFDTWGDYLSALGVPDYAVDIPRAPQTNALMLAAFERIGVALCERAVQADLRGAVAVNDRVLFRFELPTPTRALTDEEFAARFDLLHRRILAYPAALAPDGRIARFRTLYRGAVERHADAGARAFNGPEAGWASVCEGLVRHPEFHLY
ncbi:MAG: putative rane protein [Myxococcaceae bacterium]|nr:putative rane protein [Myxococcaceae bacterium]